MDEVLSLDAAATCGEGSQTSLETRAANVPVGCGEYSSGGEQRKKSKKRLRRLQLGLA